MERDTHFRDTAGDYVLDKTGSMRGRPITVAYVEHAGCARWNGAGRGGDPWLHHGGWKGGTAREEWLKAGKPASLYG